MPPAGYLAAAREITARHGALLVLDEVQTGIGRTGHWFAHQADGRRARRHHAGQGPRRRPADRRLHRLRRRPPTCSQPGTHGTTFGGNPVACAAALAVLDTIDGRGPARPRQPVGERLRRGIEALGHPLVAEVRGAGLLLGIVLTDAGVGRGRRPRLRDAGLPGQRRRSRTRSGSPRR